MFDARTNSTYKRGLLFAKQIAEEKMKDWHIGQKVKCIDDDDIAQPGPQAGGVYTIEGFADHPTLPHLCMCFEEFPGDIEWHNYYAEMRFRPLTQSGVDMLKRIALKEKVDA